jgi:16S rRNA G966 N2-methylase RsmD
LIAETLKLLGQYPILKKDGCIILQHSQKEQLQDLPEGMYLADQRKYGENILTFVRMAAHDTGEV